MNEKMIRFLNSIHIDNVDDFDIDFEMIGRNRFNNAQWDMVIVKKTPWKYYLLREFQDGLETIKYPYSLRFSYIRRPDYKDVINLFADWYQTIYRLPHNLIISGDDNDMIYVSYVSESEKEQYAPIINDFRDFLDFIYYEFVIKEEIKSIEDQTPVHEHLEKTINEDALNQAQSDVDEEEKIEQITDRNNALAFIQEERRAIREQTEKALLENMQEMKKMEAEEKRRANLYKRGHYNDVEKISLINEKSDHVSFVGKVYSCDERAFPGGKSRVTLGIVDECGDCISVNIDSSASFTRDDIDQCNEWGQNVKVSGVADLDKFTKALYIRGHYVEILPKDEIKEDSTEVKRVELHLHSNYSQMDGINTMDAYASYAKALGHKAMAITDHAVVQAFPDAQKAAKNNDIKMLYGSEFYMVDDKLKYIKNPANIPLTNAKYVVLDLETTGLSCKYNDIIEFGAVKVINGMVMENMDLLVNPGYPLPQKIVEITDINDNMLKGQPSLKDALPKIIEFIGDAVLVTHNATFDFSFLQEGLKKCGMPLLTNPVVDTLDLSRYLFPNSKSHRLGALCANFEVNYDEESAHRADYDAKVLNDAWQLMIGMITKNQPNLTHAELANLETPKELLKHIRPSHIIALAKNKQGLKDLYTLVSLSHIDYLADVPKIPRNLIDQYRENLILGSACFNGEVFEAASYYNDNVLKDKMKFYDYIEIQPLENYSYLINMGDISNDELLKIIHTIVDCADEINKPVCATGDVHYVTPTHKEFRDVYISAKGIGGVAHPLNPYARNKKPPFPNPDQHFRSTDEMLECMSFLGKEKAYEVTITNTNLIADQIESILPVPNDHLYTPHMDNCENILKDMCINKAKELYGDPLPQLIQDRLNIELNGIIDNGYSVIYYIAHLLVKKANDDGFLVGSRGSVGSSFVATMSGVTEVNPLPPHYRCPKCKHIEWTSETMPEYKSGYDLPNKKCPICGEEMIHDGQNIPFQTFLGFKADKVPDIDLNFPGDYQANAHDYTKVILGEQNVFRAGTISTVQFKTAFGFARGYLERKFEDEIYFSKPSLGRAQAKEKAKENVDKYPRARIAYLASGCVGVKRTTGQHPGGIVVVPTDHNVYDFTPVQYPANEMDAHWKTTHFDFHSIHDTILKLDLLGHVDPVALKMMSTLTGVDATKIPLNDPKVLSIFSSPKALKMNNDYIKAENGALAIPEFGTEFVRGILDTTKPKSFSDLVILSGLSHGTGVWNGNADKLIKEGTATLREVIGCRDDIMTYLISKGIDSSVSFSIMEDVRKGRGLKEQYVKTMEANGVPQFYIDSCNLIQYMFPKGHAVAYVTMAIRVGYFKVYYPLEFYATFFSVRTDYHDIKTAIAGREAVIAKLEELKTKSRLSNIKLTPKEEGQIDTLQVALEMIERGYSFANLDLYKSDAVNFVVDHERKCLIPPFITIDGLGANNAVTVIEARKDGEFFSKEDLLRRTKLTTTNVDDLSEMGVLDNLNDTDQLSLFDF